MGAYRVLRFLRGSGPPPQDNGVWKSTPERVNRSVEAVGPRTFETRFGVSRRRELAGVPFLAAVVAGVPKPVVFRDASPTYELTASIARS